MDAFDDARYAEVAVMKPTQAGVSQLAMNYAGKRMHRDPCSIRMIQPTEEDGRKFFENKLWPLLRSTPDLASVVTQFKRGQAGGSRSSKVVFPGGYLELSYAHSAGSLQSSSDEVIFADEIDEYPPTVGGAGDPLLQAIARQRTFPKRRAFMFGKPKTAAGSRIAKLYAESDQRKWFVPCARCGAEFLPTWQQIRWPEEQPRSALLHCAACDYGMTDPERMAACRKGRWEATNPGHWRAGFHFPSWITPWVPRLGDLIVRFLEAKRAGPEQLQVFVNSEMAEPWSAVGEQLRPDDLEGRAEEYDTDPLPERVLFITAGADVQADRVECELVGWAEERESWSLGYFVIRGDPDGPELWADVDALLARKFRHPAGYLLPVAAACIDSGGHHTQAVYRFCTPRSGRRIYAIKGRGGKSPVWARQESRRNILARGGGHPVHIIGVDTAKESVYHSLRRVAPGPNYCHLLLENGPEWFAGLTAEERVEGRKGIEWHRKGSQPNEPWDCRVYAYAALESCFVGGLDLSRLSAARATKRVAEVAERVPPDYANRRPGKIAFDAPKGPEPTRRGGRIDFGGG